MALTGWGRAGAGGTCPGDKEHVGHVLPSSQRGLDAHQSSSFSSQTSETVLCHPLANLLIVQWPCAPSGPPTLNFKGPVGETKEGGSRAQDKHSRSPPGGLPWGIPADSHSLGQRTLPFWRRVICSYHWKTVFFKGRGSVL